MILIKWVVQGVNAAENANLITAMINLALQMGGCDKSTAVLDVGLQTSIQQMLLTLAVLTVPLMLLAKPIIMSRHHDSKAMNINSI